jgi:hypothetical protein
LGDQPHWSSFEGLLSAWTRFSFGSSPSTTFDFMNSISMKNAGYMVIVTAVFCALGISLGYKADPRPSVSPPAPTPCPDATFSPLRIQHEADGYYLGVIPGTTRVGDPTVVCFGNKLELVKPTGEKLTLFESKNSHSTATRLLLPPLVAEYPEVTFIVTAENDGLKAERNLTLSIPPH